jgi:surface antigen
MRTRLRPTALLAFATAALLLAGCETPPGHEKEQAGTVVGAVVGGVIGSQFGHGGERTAATIIGAIAGGAIGSAVGRDMDRADRMRTAQVLESSPTGAPTSWRNPDTGHAYTVVPTRTWQSAEGPCREYTVDSVVGGRAEKVYGTACRQPDGSWRAVN